jgi:hypothetical protein
MLLFLSRLSYGTYVAQGDNVPRQNWVTDYVNYIMEVMRTFILLLNISDDTGKNLTGDLTDLCILKSKEPDKHCAIIRPYYL